MASFPGSPLKPIAHKKHGEAMPSRRVVQAPPHGRDCTVRQFPDLVVGDVAGIPLGGYFLGGYFKTN